MLEQIGHAKGACLVGHDGHHPGAQLCVFEQGAQHAHKGHGGAHLFAARLGGKAGVAGQIGHRHDRTSGQPLGQVAAQAVAALVQVTHLCAIGIRL